MPSPNSFSIHGNIVDVLARTIAPARVDVRDGRIEKVSPATGPIDNFLMPGFVDAHVHIESSLLPPAEFARLAVVHGTIATVSDPHEIANVLGAAGVSYMQDSAAQAPLKVLFGGGSRGLFFAQLASELLDLEAGFDEIVSL